MEQTLAALKRPELKSKYLSMDDLFALILFQKDLASEFETLVIAEQTTSTEFGATIVDGKFHCVDPAFYKRLAEIKTKDVPLKKSNFIAKPDFQKLTEDLDFATVSLLYESLVKKD